MLRCEVLKPIPGYPHTPGECIDADFRNTDTLIRQRFLRPVGDRERLDALEARIAALETQLSRQSLDSRQRRGN